MDDIGRTTNTAAEEAKPFTMRVEHGKIREFAAATGACSSSYRDDPAPTVPPTFLATSAHWIGPENLALRSRDLRRVLHGEQEYIFPAGPPRAGDVLTARQRVESRYHKQGKRGGSMEFVVVVTEFRNEGGDLVCEARSTIIQTGVTP